MAKLVNMDKITKMVVAGPALNEQAEEVLPLSIDDSTVCWCRRSDKLLFIQSSTELFLSTL